MKQRESTLSALEVFLLSSIAHFAYWISLMASVEIEASVQFGLKPTLA